MTAFSPQNAEFDNFLFAPILDQDGLSLRVISALAREGLDPWQEATRLAELPRDEATNSLAATLWKTNSELISPTQANILASHLVQLLPVPRVMEEPVSVVELDLVVVWLVYGIFMGLATASGNVNQQAKHQETSAQTMTLQETAAHLPHATEPRAR